MCCAKKRKLCLVCYQHGANLANKSLIGSETSVLAQHFIPTIRTIVSVVRRFPLPFTVPVPVPLDLSLPALAARVGSHFITRSISDRKVDLLTHSAASNGLILGRGGCGSVCVCVCRPFTSPRKRELVPLYHQEVCCESYFLLVFCLQLSL